MRAPHGNVEDVWLFLVEPELSQCAEHTGAASELLNLYKREASTYAKALPMYPLTLVTWCLSRKHYSRFSWQADSALD